MKVTGKIWCSLFLLMLLGCRTAEVAREDCGYISHTSMAERLVRDSVFVHDSIFLREKADTVFLIKYRTMYKERLLRDTVVVRDTLHVERQVIKKVRQRNGVVLWLLLLLVPLTCAVIWWFWKRAGKEA